MPAAGNAHCEYAQLHKCTLPHRSNVRQCTHRAHGTMEGVLVVEWGSPGVQTYSLCFHLFTWQRCSLIVRNILHGPICDLAKKIVSNILQVP